MAVSAKAQIFLQDDEGGNRSMIDPENGAYIDLPEGYGLGVDYFTPIGSGIVILAALGGAYLLNKNNNQTNNK